MSTVPQKGSAVQCTVQCPRRAVQCSAQYSAPEGRAQHSLKGAMQSHRRQYREAEREKRGVEQRGNTGLFSVAEQIVTE